ncbi:MAG TPA: hypothetical protein VGC58_01715 [Candidatus Paceibacterota bacterium]
MKKTIGEIVKAIRSHGEKIYLASAYPSIFQIEMRKGGYTSEDPEYSFVSQQVAAAVNAFRRRARRES